MSSTHTIRRLTSADIQAFRKIRLTSLQRAPESLGANFAVEAAQSESFFEERLNTSIILGAFLSLDAAEGQAHRPHAYSESNQKSEIVGMIGAKRHEGPRSTHKASMWGLYVEPEQRGARLGPRLVQDLLHAVPESYPAVEQMILTVVATNVHATALYERAGFTVFGTEPRALKTSSEYFDMVSMIRFL